MSQHVLPWWTPKSALVWSLDHLPNSKMPLMFTFQTQTRLIHSYICIPAHAGHIFNYIYIYTCRCRWVCVCVCVSRCATVSWQSSIHFMVMDSTLTLWFSRQIIACKHIIYMFIPVHLSSGPIPNVIIHWVASRDNLQFYTGCSGFYRIGPNCRGLWNQPEFHPDQFQKFKILVMAKCGGCVGF